MSILAVLLRFSSLTVIHFFNWNFLLAEILTVHHEGYLTVAQYAPSLGHWQDFGRESCWQRLTEWHHDDDTCGFAERLHCITTDSNLKKKKRRKKETKSAVSLKVTNLYQFSQKFELRHSIFFLLLQSDVGCILNFACIIEWTRCCFVYSFRGDSCNRTSTLSE